MTDRIQAGQLFAPVVHPRTLHGKGVSLHPQPVVDHGQKPFREILQDKIVRFSQHAETRIRQRGIELQAEQLTKIGNAIDKAKAKGAKDSLILYKDMALIVNVKNRTVITAVDGSSMTDHVFTQIDSAVIIQ